MTIQVNIGEAKTRLSELLAKVEAGEDVVIARGGRPQFEVRLIERDHSAARAAAARIRERRARIGGGGIGVDEVLSMRDEGKR